MGWMISYGPNRHHNLCDISQARLHFVISIYLFDPVKQERFSWHQVSLAGSIVKGLNHREVIDVIFQFYFVLPVLQLYISK